MAQQLVSQSVPTYYMVSTHTESTVQQDNYNVKPWLVTVLVHCAGEGEKNALMCVCVCSVITWWQHVKLWFSLCLWVAFAYLFTYGLSQLCNSHRERTVHSNLNFNFCSLVHHFYKQLLHWTSLFQRELYNTFSVTVKHGMIRNTASLVYMLVTFKLTYIQRSYIFSINLIKAF